MRHDGLFMSDPYGNKAVWRIAAPMMLSSISSPLLGMVDTAVVGHLGEAWHLGAVAAGATIFNVLFMGLNFLRMGTTGITAQAHGAGDFDGMRGALLQSLAIAFIVSLCLIAAQQPLLSAGVRLLGAGPEVTAFTGDYFRIRIWSAPAALCNFVIIGWLLGMQNARGPLAIVLTINVINIALDLLFVVGLGLKADGVALATLLAEAAGLAVGAMAVTRELGPLRNIRMPARLLRWGAYRSLFRINRDLFLRTLALMFCFAFVTAQGARMGDLVLAANALLMNFQYLLAYALDGIAHAAEALTGKAAGEGNRAGLERAVRRTLKWSLLFAGLFSLAYWLGGVSIIDLLTTIEGVRETALDYLPWLIVLPLISVWSFLYDGVFVGTTRSREMCIVMVGSVLLVFLPVWYLFRDAGNHALWLAFTMFMAARGIGMHAWFRYLLAGNALTRVRTYGAIDE